MGEIFPKVEKRAQDKNGILYPYEPSEDGTKIIIKGEEVEWRDVYTFPTIMFSHDEKGSDSPIIIIETYDDIRKEKIR